MATAVVVEVTLYLTLSVITGLAAALLFNPSLAAEPEQADGFTIANYSETLIHAESNAYNELTQEEQKRILLNLLAGEFSNLRNIFEHGPSGGYPPVLIRQKQVNEAGLWVQQSTIAAPDRVYRQQYYHFVIPRRANYIRQDVYLLPNDFAGDFSNIEALPEELQAVVGCAIHWYPRSDSWVGERSGEFCAFRDENNEVVAVNSTIQLDTERYQITETAVSSNGEPLLGDIEGLPLVLQRIRFFHAELSYLPAGADGNDDNQWMAANPQRLMHDHEQRVALMSANEGLFLGHDIQLLTDSNDPQQLTLRVYRQTEDEPLFVVALEYHGSGEWRATHERLRVQLRAVDSVTELLPQR